MKGRSTQASSLVFLCLLIMGCAGGGNDFADLQSFIETTNNRPKGAIEPMPSFEPVEVYTYNAVNFSMRSPFQAPAKTADKRTIAADASVKPDLTRPKEYLERYPLGRLTMVGTIRGLDDVLWALIDDSEGQVHKIREGNYLGQNHGEVLSVDDTSIELIEIVPAGDGGWIKRPRVLSLNIDS